MMSDLLLCLGGFLMFVGLIVIIASFFVGKFDTEMFVCGMVVLLLGSTGFLGGLVMIKSGYAVGFDIGTYEISAVDTANSKETYILARKLNEPEQKLRLYRAEPWSIHWDKVPRIIRIVDTENGYEIISEFAKQIEQKKGGK